MGAPDSVLVIDPSVQNYSWGTKGSKSLVCQLARAAGGGDSSVDQRDQESTCFAELWVGNHPSAPSKVKDTTLTVGEFAKKHPEFFGNRDDESAKEQRHPAEAPKAAVNPLPFLLKVLSVAEPLSIQSHPDKETAEQLHRSRPEIYKDDNHKPEAAVALTPFEALCGAMSWNKTVTSVTKLAPLREVLGDQFFTEHARALESTTAHDQRNEMITFAHKDVFKRLIEAPPEATAKASSELLTLADNKAERDALPDPLPDQLGLFKRLHSHYPGDNGCFCAFLLNHVHMQPGEAIAIGPNIPHAYLHGNCIEAMANSDNVIRAGLTPKFKDIPLLLEKLNTGDGTVNFIKPSEVSKYSEMAPIVTGSCRFNVYCPPIKEFQILEIGLIGDGSVTATLGVSSAAAIIVVNGAVKVTSGGVSKTLGRGSCALIRRGMPVEFMAADAAAATTVYATTAQFT